MSKAGVDSRFVTPTGYPLLFVSTANWKTLDGIQNSGLNMMGMETRPSITLAPRSKGELNLLCVGLRFFFCPVVDGLPGSIGAV
ncbi:hypothetical protein E2C01_069133 [Portunus trituberculatus]|uniref:Uncharacterized protein n=1 Tax=Portunus trituberculatus TaxID=210409 RepID=A0A5B7I1C7_PORTR|nr:hypothetical protein [Portunus trituberculatus]